MQLKFIAHRKGISSKNNMPYNFVKLSNGKLEFNLSPSKKDMDFSEFAEGDDVECTFTVNPVLSHGLVVVYPNIETMEHA